MAERRADPKWELAERRAVELRRLGHRYEGVAEMAAFEHTQFTEDGERQELFGLADELAGEIRQSAPGKGLGSRAQLTRRPYQVRYSYDPGEEVAKAAIHSRHEHVDDAAPALISCTAPYKQVVVEHDGQLEFLDELEEARLEALCSKAGYEVEEIEG